MRKTMAQKIICLIVASVFSINNIAYGLSPMPGSTQPGTKDAMYALGQKLFAAKNGPGAIDFDSYGPGPFIGNELLNYPDHFGAYTIEEANGYGTKFVKADYDNLPEAWKNNPLLKETDLISAFEAFRDTEAKIPAENLDIKEGYFPVDEEKGELPIAHIEKVGENKYVLVVHTKFVQMWNHIRKNDVWFEANLGPNDRRTMSVAWGIFYRLAKHELTDLKRENLLPKSVGHMRYINGEIVLNEDEITANTIGGNYQLVNDAIWIWFLGAYCFGNTTRYNNGTFLERMYWMFYGKGATELRLDSEFPRLLPGGNNHTIAMAFAYAINYNFFNRPDVVVPKASVDEKFIREYEEREEARKAIDITEKPIYTTGQAPAPAPAEKITVGNLSVDALTKAVIAAIGSDFATTTQQKYITVGLWNDFIKERAIERMIVNIADVEETLVAEIKNDKVNRNIVGVAGLAAIGVGAVPVLISTSLWPISLIVAGGAALIIIVNFTSGFYKEKSFAALAGYLKKAKEDILIKEEVVRALSGTAINGTTLIQPSTIIALKDVFRGGYSESDAYIIAFAKILHDVITAKSELRQPSTTEKEQTPPAAEKVTVENLSVDALTEAVIAAIRSDFATKIQKVISLPITRPLSLIEILAQEARENKSGQAAANILAIQEKTVELWNSFIKENARFGVIANIANLEETLAAKIKSHSEFRKEGLIVGPVAIIAGLAIGIFTGVWPLVILTSVMGATIFITSVLNTNTGKTLAALAGYLKKAKEGLASQTVTTTEKEQTPPVAEKTPIALSAGEAAMPVVQPTVEEHPLIRLISEYIVRLGLEKGPGTEALSTAELENIYKTVNLLREDNIEIFIPQQVKLTEDMQKAIKDMGKREGGNYVTCRQYSDLENLARQLQSPPIGKRMVITDIAEKEDREHMARLVARYPESFRAIRLLNITLPVNYFLNMGNTEKTVYQSKIVTIAILARLFEKDKTPMVEMLLRYMIKGCLDVDEKGMNEYIDELGTPNDGQGLSRDALAKRILFLIGNTIKVVERIGEEIRLMKAFWTAA